MSGATLARRLENVRATGARIGAATPATQLARRDRTDDAQRLATAVGGNVVATEAGVIVHYEGPPRTLRVDRERLATLPGQPPADVPLVCLDTETTGLGTAAGTVAFLVGLGWWERDVFRQVQLILPDHSDEPALLDAIEALIPADAWLVTYNGRSFDWPLLVARFRLARREPPRHAGHLDLLPVARLLFRHRTGDARLKTIESALLGVTRHDDVEGWQIPGLYLDFLRGGPAGPIAEIVRHNDEDVRSLARLLALLDTDYGDPVARSSAPEGDLAGLAAAFRRQRRLEEALGCLDAAVSRPRPVPTRPVLRWDDHGVRLDPSTSVADRGRIEAERARLLRRLGRHHDAAAAWLAISTVGGALAVRSHIELAKIHEHVDRDPVRALQAADRAHRLLDGVSPALLQDPLRRDLERRRRRLRRRVDPGTHGPPDRLEHRRLVTVQRVLADDRHPAAGELYGPDPARGDGARLVEGPLQHERRRDR